MKMYRRILRWRGVVFSLLLLLLLAACSRSDVGKGLTVKVIDETEDTTPFGSEAQGAERAPGAGYDVYLTPADTPLSELARVQSGWRQLATDADGQAVFPDIEGRFHALVDVNGNGRIDQRALNVPSGSTVEIVVSALAGGDDGDNWLQLTLDRRTYFPGGEAEVTLVGWLAGDDGEPAYLDLWYQDGNDETRLLRKDLGEYSGDVSLTTQLVVEHDWPVTPEDTANDFLLVPRAFGKYYSGARFSVRGLEESIAITNIGLTINGGNAETVSRNVTLALEAENAETVAFGEDLDHLLGGATRFPYQEEYGYQLSAGDGPKTVYAIFFDARGNFAGPVQDSIILNAEGPPPAPVTNMSVTINGGDAVASQRLVTLTFTADNADRIAFGEDPDVLATARRVQFESEYDFQLSPGDVTKTVYAMFFNTRGEAAGPVSDSILLRSEGPSIPNADKLHVIENHPGTDDELWGEPGAADPNTTIRVYSDLELTHLLGTGTVGADGSFNVVNIGDGSIPGNVFKPGDYVFVTATDFLGRESRPAAVVNDSTPPVLYRDQVRGHWVWPALPAGWIGNPGNTFEAEYRQPTDDPAADDVAGGYVDFSAFGGGVVPLTPRGGNRFTATMVLGHSEPHGTHQAIDSANLILQMRIFDEAGNISDWVTSDERFSADNIMPDPPVLTQPVSGNRELGLYWPNPVPYARNDDIQAFDLMITEASSGDIVYRTQLYGDAYYEGLALGNGRFMVDGLPNCRDYVVRVASIDDALNRSAFSVPVTGTTILPAPEFEAWGGVTTDNGGVVTFGMKPVDFANAYEVHFSDESGPPYSFTTPGGSSSPRMVGDFNSPPAYTDRIEELTIGTKLYLSPRSIDEDDPTCFSEYGPEVTATSDLRILTMSDGDADDSIGGALAATYWSNGLDLDLLVGAPYAKEVVVLDPRDDNNWLGSFGTFDIPISYDIPGTPLAVVDLKGDGEPWYVVGSPRESPSNLLLAGRVRVYDSTGVEQLSFDGDAIGLHFGFSVANLGDLDGSGGENFAVGGFGCLHGDCGVSAGGGQPTQGPGKVIIYGYNAVADDIVAIREHGQIEGVGGGDMFGISIHGGVDLGPGFENTYAIGSPGTGLYSPIIAVRWYHGATGDIIGRLASSMLTSNEPSGRMVGAAITAVDDISGDGLPDWIVGMPWRSSTDSGSIVAVRSDPEALFWSPLWTLSGELARASARFGSVLASGGDVNGDGFPNVIVGAPGGLQDYFYGPGSAYAVAVHTGRLAYEIRGGALDGSLGYSVLLPGNLTGEGYDEWVVGAPGSAYGGLGSGRVYVLTSDPDEP